MLLSDIGIEHIAGVILLPQLTMMGTAVVKSLRWKLSSHLSKGGKVTVNGEEAVIMAVNFTGLHIKYTEDQSERTISVSKLDALDVRKQHK